MPIQAQDGGSGISNPASLTKFVRDVIQREPPRPVAAQSFGTVTAADAIHTPAVVVGGVTQPKITTRSLSLGPPPNPADGDIWIARDVDANGTRWQFQYNAGSSSAYKWEFIGGSDLVAYTASLNSTPSGAWTYDASHPALTLARAGDYVVRFGAARAGTGGANEVGYFNVSDVTASVSSPLGPSVAVSGNGVNYQQNGSAEWTLTGFPAGHTLGLVSDYSGASALATWDPWLAVAPIRIK